MVEEKMRRKILVSALMVLFIVSIIPVLAVKGETGEVILKVKVLGHPVAVASATVDYLTVNFDGSDSYDPDGKIEIYSWNFGDEESEEGEKVDHTYSDKGTYTVTLTVTDDDGLTDSDILTLKVTRRRIVIPGRPNTDPIANAGPSQKAWVEEIVYFDGSKSKDPDGTIISYDWDFGDETPSASGVTVEHEYSVPGVYEVTLTVRDNRWAEDSDTCKVKISGYITLVSNKFAERVPGGKKNHVVEAFEEANTTVTLDTTDNVTVTVLRYEDNPYPEDPIPAMALPNYVDVEVSDPDAVVWPIYVEMFYTDEEVEGLNEDSLGIYYWFNGTWQRCSDTGVDIERNVVWAYMTAEEASGSPILMGGTRARVAEFVVSYLKIEPRRIELGGTVTISVNVTNVGETEGSYNVTLNIEEDLIISVKEVTLQGGESEIVKFEFVPEAEGTYDLEIEGMIGTIFVIIPIPVPPLPPYLSNLTVTPNEIELRDNVTISVDIRNMDSQSITYAVDMHIENVNDPPPTWPPYNVTLRIWVDLEAYESKIVSHTITMDTFGDFNVTVIEMTGNFTVKAPPKPAEFEFSDLRIFYPGVISPEVESDQTLTVAVSIEAKNVGEQEGGHTVDLKVDEYLVDSQEVTLEGGASETVLFELERGEGTYQVEVEGLTGSFTLELAEEPPFWMVPGYVAGIIIIIIAAIALLYAIRKGKLPSLSPEIDDEI